MTYLKNVGILRSKVIRYRTRNTEKYDATGQKALQKHVLKWYNVRTETGDSI